MSTFRMSQGWAPWWVKAIGVALWAPLAWAVWQGGPGVRSWLWPLPLGNGRRVLRVEFADVYAGHVKVKRRGVVVEEVRSMGVATRGGLQVDRLNGFAGQEGALDAARQVAGVLGVEVYTSNAPDSGMYFRRTALLWLGLFVVATVAGAVWELG